MQDFKPYLDVDLMKEHIHVHPYILFKYKTIKMCYLIFIYITYKHYTMLNIFLSLYLIACAYSILFHILLKVRNKLS